MDRLRVVIKYDDSVVQIEKETIQIIHNSLCDIIREGDPHSVDELTYNARISLCAPDEPHIKKECILYTKLHKCSDNMDMQGKIYSVSSTINNFRNAEGSIHITDNIVTGKISIDYKNYHYYGDITGKSVCNGFTPIFTCISDLRCDDNNDPVHLECTFASVITDLCSDHSIYKKLAELCKNNTLPYSRYIAGWKRIGNYYRYISPLTQTSVETPEQTKLSSENVYTVLEYINNDMCLPVFFMHFVHLLSDF